MAMSQQEVIKKFMSALDTTKKIGDKALDEAVKAATGGKVATADEVIEKMIADCKKSKNANDFLMTYYGINLNNNDTGAITGSDAGGKTVKNAEDIVPESGALKHFTGTSFTKRGLKFILPTTIKDDTIGTAKDKNYIIDALYTWWAEEALKLIETSYGFNFNDKDATVREISIDFFYDKTPGADIAYTERYDRDEYGNYDGKINRMVLKINMAHYKDFRTSDQNGKSPTGNPYLDRTIAHELTHAIMNAKIDYRYKLPNFISEGMAELTHGIDDESKSRITALAQNTNNRLEKALDIKRTGENTSAASDEYAAGYMFLRYLAKNYSTSAVTAGLNVTNSNKNSIVSGTNYNDTIKNIAGGAVIRGGKGNDSIYSSTEKNYTVKSSYGYVTIDGGEGADTIYSNDPYVSISGGKGNDSIYSKSSTVTIRGGEGVDTITNYSRHTNIYGDSEGDRIENHAGGVTIYGGGGNDFIKNDTTDKKVTINSAYGYVTIDGGAGNDTIENNNPNVSLSGGADNDRISVGSYANVTVNGGKGNDVIYGNRNTYSVTYVYNSGDGNDTIYNFHANDKLKISGSSTTVKSGSDTKIKVGSGSLLLKNYSVANSNEISLTASNNNYTVSASGKTIYALAGNDNIKNAYSNVTIHGGAGNESILNQNKNVAIYGENDNDSIVNSSDNVKIYGGEGADTIDNHSNGSNVTVYGNAGNDLIKNNGSNVKIYGDAGNDKISIGTYAKTVTVNGGGDNDTVENNGSNIKIYGGAGADSIVNYGFNPTVKGSSVGKNVYIMADDGNDYIANSGVNVTISGGDGADKINNTSWGVNASINGGIGNDSIVNNAKASVYGGNGNDTLTNTDLGSNSKLYGGNDNDLITTYNANNVFIDGGAGADKISITGGGTKNTISGGLGNDLIYSTNAKGVTYLYKKGDGNDVIRGWTAKDTLSITGGAYKLSTVGNNVKVSIAGGSFVTLVGAKGKTINVKSSATSSKLSTSADMVEDFWFEENDFITDDAQISDITEISSPNNSIGKLELSTTYDLLEPNEQFIAAVTSDKHKLK